MGTGVSLGPTTRRDLVRRRNPGTSPAWVNRIQVRYPWMR